MENLMDDKEKTNALFPSTQEICTEISLYEEFDISAIPVEELVRFEASPETIDAYCIFCKQDSIFHKETEPHRMPLTPRPGGSLPTPKFIDLRDRDIELGFICSRNINPRVQQ